MKTFEPFRSPKRLIILLTAVVFLTACQKTEKSQKFNDVFDVSGVTKLNDQVFAAQTSADLEKLLAVKEVDVPELFKNVTVGQLAAHFEKSIELSEHEIDMLLKNNVQTYIEVINRFGSLPPQLADISAIDFYELKRSSMNPYLLKIKEEPFNFYVDDHYSAVLAMQDFIKSAVIKPLKHVDDDKFKTRPPGLGEEPEEPAYILYSKLIASNKIWDIWWTYWSDGTRTHHKGSAGSFPG